MRKIHLIIYSKIKSESKVTTTIKKSEEKKFESDQCKGNEFQNYVKFIEVGEIRIFGKNPSNGKHAKN